MTESPDTDPTEAPAPKFRRRADARPDEILDAATGLFLEQGYAHTSVAQIATAAGLSKGAVYLYFPSKQAVLEGLVARAIQPMSMQVLAEVAAHSGSVREVVTHVLHMMAARLSDPMVLAVPRIVIRESVAAPEIARMYHDAVLAHAIPALTSFIRAGVERGELKPVDPELTVRSVMGPLLIHIFLSEIFGIVPDGGLGMDRLIDNHLSILFDGLSAEETP